VGSAPEDEFTAFILGRWSSLVRFGYGLTGDLGLAEDLAQTALARACAAWRRVLRAADPDAYVRKIMINSNRSRGPGGPPGVRRGGRPQPLVRRRA